MNDKDIRPSVRAWAQSIIGGQIEDEITVSGYRVDVAALGDFITGFEIKGDTDSINCPHFREQVKGYSRVCRRSYLVITTNRPNALKIALHVLPWYWGVLLITDNTGIVVHRQPHDSPDIEIAALLDGFHKRELSGMITKADSVRSWQSKGEIVIGLGARIPVRHAESLLSKSLKSSGFRLRNVKRKIGARKEAAA